MFALWNNKAISFTALIISITSFIWVEVRLLLWLNIKHTLLSTCSPFWCRYRCRIVMYWSRAASTSPLNRIWNNVYFVQSSLLFLMSPTFSLGPNQAGLLWRREEGQEGWKERKLLMLLVMAGWKIPPPIILLLKHSWTTFMIISWHHDPMTFHFMCP